MGKGAFRGSLHFCGQARQSARTRSKRPFPASRRRGSGDSTRICRQAGRRRPGIRPHLRFRAGRHPYRHPTALPTAGQTDTRFIRQTRAPGFRLTGTPPPHPDSPTTRPGRERGLHPPTDANRDCGIGCRTCKKSAAPGPARRPGLPEKGRKPRIHICIHLPFKFLGPSLASDRRHKPLSFKFMFLLIVDYVS